MDVAVEAWVVAVVAGAAAFFAEVPAFVAEAAALVAEVLDAVALEEWINFKWLNRLIIRKCKPSIIK